MHFLGLALTVLLTSNLRAAAPGLVEELWDQTVDSGMRVEFYVEACGDEPLGYQWYHDGSLLPDITGPYWVIQSASPNDAGRYGVVVTNDYGTCATMMTLTVRVGPPRVTYWPRDVEVCSGCELWSLDAYVAGSRPFYYQWRFNGTDLPDASGQTWEGSLAFYITNMSTLNAGEYSLVVTNDLGAVTGTVARVTMGTSPPVIVTQPADYTGLEGYDFSLSVVAISCQRASFQWRSNEVDVPEATSSTLSFRAPTTNQTASYSVVVSNALGAVTSRVAQVTLRQQAPQILNQPESQSVLVGDRASFSVLAIGGPSPSYQWQFNGQDIPGATSPDLGFWTSSTNQTGAYSVIVANSFGSVTSAPAILTVLVQLPVFDHDPVSQGSVVGNPVDLWGTAHGNPPPSFQWQFNDQDIPGATNLSLDLWSVAYSNAGNYRLVAGNEAGWATSRVATLTVSAPGPLDRWGWRHPLPQGNDLFRVAYGNGSFVALGYGKTRVCSLDGGVTWQDDSGDPAGMIGLAFGNGIFVAVRSGGFDTSTNGIDWIEQPLNEPGQTLRDIAFGNGRFVAVGDYIALVSTNGIDWEEHAVPEPAWRITFGHGLFLALGSEGPGSFLLSSDGVDWTTNAFSFGGSVHSVAYGNDKFVACIMDYWGNSPHAVMLVSSNAVSWTRKDIGLADSLVAVTYGGGKFVAVGGNSSGVVAISTDGDTWELHQGMARYQLYSVAFGAEQFVAVGNHGNILTSPDAVNWTYRSSGTSINLRSVAHGPGRYEAVGNEGLMFTSLDGVAWSRLAPPTTNNIRGVVFGNGRWVAVGEADTNGATILASADGQAWTRQTTATTEGLYGVTIGDDLFVAVGDLGRITVSSNGLAWRDVFSGTRNDRFNAVTHGPGLFVAVGRNGAIVTSTNALNWARRFSGTSEYLQGVAVGNGIFVAGGKHGAMVRSTNGIDWAVQPVRSYSDIEDVQFANGLFIAVGSGDLFPVSSPDGIIWTKHRSGCETVLRSLTCAEGRVVAVGNNETILQSGFSGPPLLRLGRPVAPNGPRLRLEAELGSSWRLEASPDLREWTTIFSFTADEEITEHEDPDLQPCRFYRVVSP